MSTKYIVNNVTGQTINGQELQPYKVYTALLTQSGGNNPQYVYSGDLTVGVTYLINSSDPTQDFTNVGAPNNNVGTYFVATGATPNSWGNGAELEYNTGAPVVTVLQNTIGNVVWTYTLPGNYLGSLTNAFPFNKTFCQGATSTIEDGTGFKVITVTPFNSDSISVFSVLPISESPYDDLLYYTPIEIRVYS